MEQAGVGDQDEFHLVETAGAFEVGGAADDFVEVLVARRFAVAGKGDVVEAAAVGGDGGELGMGPDFAGADLVDEGFHFAEEAVGFDEGHFRFGFGERSTWQ